MDNLVGQQFDRYKLIRYLGDGSFADVYLGEHVYLKKSVAVKVLRVYLPNSDRESFSIEASTIASLEHPHIVQVLDSGVYHNIPFLVMNYASHGTLRQRHPDHTILSPTIVLSYVKQIASALQYAHDRKLIHRDVKPHNILLGPEDELWLSDFGLAMIAHSSMSRITENTGGTPGYMAPEQFVGKTCQASDQYALAVMAYEWLCGERPFQGSHSELFNQHTYAPVPPLREKLATISPAIEKVVLRALAKDPHQRFVNVQAFADALEQAYLFPGSGSDLGAPSSQKELPPMVRQPTSSFDTETPTILSPMRSFPSAQDAIAIAPGKISSASEDKRAPGFSNAPVAAFKEPETPMPPVPPAEMFREPETPMPPVSPAFSNAPVATFREPETPMPPVLPQFQASPKRAISRRRVLVGLGTAIAVASGAAIAWEFATATNVPTITHPSIIKVPSHAATVTSAPVPVGTPLLIYQGQKSGVKAAAWSPDGRFIASGGVDQTVHVWNAVSGEDVLNPPYRGHSSGLDAVAWSPNGQFIASGGEDKTVHVWNAATGKDLLSPHTQHTQTVRAVAWSPDGKFIASGSEDQTVRVWDATNGQDLPFSPYRGHIGKVTSVAWSPTHPLIASASFDGTVQIWSSTNGQRVYSFSPPPTVFGERTLAWSPDGRYIVSGGDNNNVYVWDTTTGQMAYSFSGHTNHIQAVAWSPDGQYIASGSFDHTVKIWSFATKKLILTYSHHKNQVWSVGWSHDGQYIASASVDGTVQIWKPL